MLAGTHREVILGKLEDLQEHTDLVWAHFLDFQEHRELAWADGNDFLGSRIQVTVSIKYNRPPKGDRSEGFYIKKQISHIIGRILLKIIFLYMEIEPG